MNTNNSNILQRDISSINVFGPDLIAKYTGLGVTTVRDLVSYEGNLPAMCIDEQYNIAALFKEHNLRFHMSKKDVEIYEAYPNSLVHKSLDNEEVLKKLGLSIRIQNLLKKANIRSVLELIRKSPEDLKKIKGISDARISSINNALSRLDLSLGMSQEQIYTFCKIEMQISATDNFMDSVQAAASTQHSSASQDAYANIIEAIAILRKAEAAYTQAKTALQLAINEKTSRATIKELPETLTTIARLIKEKDAK